ncbi:hypothetical protein D1872_260170 [compost metagenome]
MIHVEPIAVSRGFALLHNILEEWMVKSAMIDYQIQNNLDITLMTLSHQLMQIFYRTKCRINFEVIHGVIFMI